jgi:hypothetical protein
MSHIRAPLVAHRTQFVQLDCVSRFLWLGGVLDERLERRQPLSVRWVAHHSCLLSTHRRGERIRHVGHSTPNFCTRAIAAPLEERDTLWLRLLVPGPGKYKDGILGPVATETWIDEAIVYNSGHDDFVSEVAEAPKVQSDARHHRHGDTDAAETCHARVRLRSRTGGYLPQMESGGHKRGGWQDG